MNRLIIIGAGPKSIAIAAKSTVLSRLGFSVPEIHIVERNEIAANWGGKHGFTDGKQILGTSPEKDVGFPYQSDCWDGANAEVDQRMRFFSWSAYLIESGNYSSWVDRGRPSPCHREWASYLKWVSEALGEHVHFHFGSAKSLSLESGIWDLLVVPREGTEFQLKGNGLVLTGPAMDQRPHNVPNHDGIFTVESFWKTYRKFESLKGSVGIVGVGENAACIATTLTAFKNENLKIEVISPKGFLYSRGESFYENRVYSDPASVDWHHISKTHRREFIKRTDRGVFSQDAQIILNRSSLMEIRAGRVTQLAVNPTNRISVELEYENTKSERDYDYIIFATGSDQSLFLKRLVKSSAHEEILKHINSTTLTDQSLEETIDSSLRVSGLSPNLHLPMLSGLRQGPGFANLSCLGRLSDRILKPYVN